MTMIMMKRILAAAVAGAGVVAALSLNATAAPRFVPGMVDADGGLNTRIAPSRYVLSQSMLPDGAEVSVDCRVTGTDLGDAEDAYLWYLLSGEGDARWVSAKYVDLTGAEPGWCGPQDYLPAEFVAGTTTHAGPSRRDSVYRKVRAGGDTRVACYVYTTSAGTGRWVLTTEGDWVPAATVRVDGKVPFCQG